LDYNFIVSAIKHRPDLITELECENLPQDLLVAIIKGIEEEVAGEAEHTHRDMEYAKALLSAYSGLNCRMVLDELTEKVDTILAFLAMNQPQPKEEPARVDIRQKYLNRK
jgi:hypothetical protein